MQTSLFNYLTITFLFVTIVYPGNSFAQLSGTKSIPGDYATIEAAITALNASGVGAGGVTFNVAAGHTETFTSDTSGSIRATGTVANPIIFQKSGGGNNPIITAVLNGVSTTTDGIIKIISSDYLTFDRINLQENAGNTTATTQMEWGYALVKKDSTDGCKNVTIKNCSITLLKTNTSSSGIYSGNHRPTSTTSLVLTNSSGASSNNKFFSNAISNVNWGIRINGSTNALFYDQSNELGVDGGNNISNYGGVSVSSYGIEVQYQNNIKIANNIVNGGGAMHTGAIYGIRTGSGSNSNVDIFGNTVTLTQGGSSIMYGIVNSMGSSGAGNSVNIYNNIVENCLHPVSTSNTVWLIYNLAGCSFLKIYGNTVRNNTKSLGTGTMYCIYNTPPSTPTKVEIYDNEIYNNVSAGPIHGILSDDGLVVNIYRNEIYDLNSSSTSTGAVATAGITIPDGGDTVGVNIYNNFISDLRAPGSGFSSGIRGINITTTSVVSTIGLYYNTIFLNASGGTNFGSAGIYHTNSTAATTAALDMRNNVIVNLSISNGTGKTVAFRRSAVNVNLNNYSTISNNNIFYAGAPSSGNVIFFDGTNFDQTLTEFKIRVAPRETFSFTENIPFVNVSTAPYDLHIRTDIPTQSDSGAGPITSPIIITTDFDGDIRDGNKVNVGGDEFEGIAADFTVPSISYTFLSHTQSTANRSLTGVNVIDWNDVNVTPGTRPRIYYKRASDNNTYVDNTSVANGWKYTETSSTSSPFEFLINYSLLFGGTGVQNGDTVQYFVVAQDLFSTPNVGINSGVFASTPSSVDLTPAAFPISGTINFYRIIIQLNGIVTVGTGGNYPSLTGANGLFTAINENIVSGNLIAEVISNLTETGSSSLNQWIENGVGNYTLTIKPSSAIVRNISGSFLGGLISLNGADRVTIDGRFNGNGNYLTIENTNSASNTAAIRLISLGAGQGCSDITIRNCNIKASTGTLANTFGIFCGSTLNVNTGNGGGADFDNISVIENNISRCRAGVFAKGTSTDQMINFIVLGNIIGSDNSSEYVTEYGTYIGFADAPQVTYNEVYNIIFDASKYGLFFVANINNAFVSKNKIHSISQPGTTGWQTGGINFSSATQCSDNRIENNMIYNLSTYGNTSMYLTGIRITGGSNYKIYHNSVSINDTLGNPATNLPSACLHIPTASTNMDIRNNIFLNTRTGNSPKNYAVHSPNTTTFLAIDNNDYWTTGSVIGYFGADIATLNDWKTATGQDVNSISDDPEFISVTNLHITPGSTVVAGMGDYIATVTTDIDGDTRLDPPDIGADEFGAATTFSLSVDVTLGWNMVSAPGLHPTNQNVETWWPHRTGTVWEFNGVQYEARLVTTPGEGYWMKNTLTETYNYPAITIVPHNPVPVTLGWNLMSGYETSPTITALKAANPQITGTVWGFNGVQYEAATNLVPGYGYWAKVTAAGNIIIPDALAKGNGEVVDLFKEDWGRIILTDAAGLSYTLYAVNGEVDLDQYEMPPMPPAGTFDIRFGSGRIAENLNSAIQTIDMNGITYPLTVRVEGVDIRLQDESGRQLNANLKSGEDVVISDATIQKLMVSGEAIPTVYALEQNYPNPFNPSTKIEFSLPEDVSNVKLSIYNALGEKVAELLNSSLTAGKYSYQWNAQNVSTGMYIYELRTDKFVSVKKMMLLK